MALRQRHNPLPTSPCAQGEGQKQPAVLHLLHTGEQPAVLPPLRAGEGWGGVAFDLVSMAHYRNASV